MQSKSTTVTTLALLATGFVAGHAYAQDNNEARARVGGRALEAYISEQAVAAQYIRDIDTDKLGALEGRGGFLYNKDDDLVLTGDVLGLIGGREAQSKEGLHFRAGTRMYAAWLDEEDEDIFSVGIGGEAQYTFGDRRKYGVVLSAFYAPDLFTFGHTDHIIDASLRFQAELAPGTELFIGGRSLKFDTDLGNRQLDDNLMVGVRYAF
ncbi:MAG TPA: hypothetical protein VFX89_16570 [Gammaproteobacteria bacterium]|nr:hypothetical protein [Gammaproteobacteria bacterium]